MELPLAKLFASEVHLFPVPVRLFAPSFELTFYFHRLISLSSHHHSIDMETKQSFSLIGKEGC
jgi:hypothetical protein